MSPVFLHISVSMFPKLYLHDGVVSLEHVMLSDWCQVNCQHCRQSQFKVVGLSMLSANNEGWSGIGTDIHSSRIGYDIVLSYIITLEVGIIIYTVLIVICIGVTEIPIYRHMPRFELQNSTKYVWVVVFYMFTHSFADVPLLHLLLIVLTWQ